MDSQLVPPDEVCSLCSTFSWLMVLSDHLVLFVQGVFVAEDVSNIIKECLDNTLQSQQYDADMVPQWTNECLESCIRRLTTLSKPFKYIVTCLILQKTGAGLHTAASCFWDSSTDGSRTVRWENKSMYCICSVFGLAL